MTTTRNRFGGAVSPAETVEGRLKISVCPDLLVLDDGRTTTVWNYREGTRLRVDGVAGRLDTCVLEAVAQSRLSSVSSVEHALRLLQVGGARGVEDSVGTLAQAEASFGIAFSPGAPAAFRAESGSGGGDSWSSEESEVARVRWSGQALDAHALRRLFAAALPLHPAVAADIAAHGRVPAFIRAVCRFAPRDTEAEWTLESVAPGHVDLPALTAGLQPAPPLDECHARARGGEIADTEKARIGAARAAIEAERWLEGQLGVLAHALSSTDPVGPAVQAIRQRASWWSPARRLQRILDKGGSPQALARKLEGFKAHAGKFAYLLDVFIGETLLPTDRRDEAEAALRRALREDPGLAGAWISLGEAYQRKRAYEAAWDCFRYARALCQAHPLVLTRVTDVERRLHAEHPQFF